MKNKKLLIILSLPLILLTFLVINKSTTTFDSFIYNLIIKLQSNNMTHVVKFITNLANPLTLIFLTIVLILINFKNIYKYLIPINLIFGTIMNNIIKIIIKRPRPIDINLITERGFSFPSGHAMLSIMFYGYLAYLITKKVDKKYHLPIYITTSIIILLIGISRIYLGVHFASDIIGGYLCGIISLLLFIDITNGNLTTK